MKWETVAPIASEYRDREDRLGEPFDLGGGVSIGPYSLWSIDPRYLNVLSFDLRTKLQRETKHALVSEYDASSLGERDPAWQGNTPRSKQDTAEEKVQLANLGLWLARPSALGFKLVVHQHKFEGEKVAMRHKTFWWVRPFPPYENTSLNHADLQFARALFTGLREVPRSGALWVAVRTLYKAIVEREGWIRLPLLWIAIEALFGPENMKKVRDTISDRIGRFLTEDGEGSAEIGRKVRENYWWRSAVLHGLRLPDGDQEETQGVNAVLSAELTLRDSLLKILLHPELMTIFSGGDREPYLDRGSPKPSS